MIAFSSETPGQKSILKRNRIKRFWILGVQRRGSAETDRIEAESKNDDCGSKKFFPLRNGKPSGGLKIRIPKRMRASLELTDRTSLRTLRILIDRKRSFVKGPILPFRVDMKARAYKKRKQNGEKSGFETFCDHFVLMLMISQY